MLSNDFPRLGGVPTPGDKTTTHIEFLGRKARTGSWEELAQGTFKVAVRAVRDGKFADAVDLIEVSLLEAQELREIYEDWPKKIVKWLRVQGAPEDSLDEALNSLQYLIGSRAARGIEVAWPGYSSAAERAVNACKRGDQSAAMLIEHARVSWLTMHDEAVDRVCGLIDIAVRMLGERRLGELWDLLLSDWYEIHAQRYSLDHQPWEVSAHQLMVSIVDGFHAHLAGSARQGDIELIMQPDRIGFRFAPCGSGGRTVDSDVTGGQPRSGHPFNFAVTTEEHDWAWNKSGICSYCVHCCLLNEVMPIDRIGHPTRVIDPPVWGESNRANNTLHDGSRADSTLNTSCTWWVYRHPSLVPDAVYRRVGRSPDHRPKSNQF